MILKRKGALREAQRYAELNLYLYSGSIFQKWDVGKCNDLTCIDGKYTSFTDLSSFCMN